MLYALAYIDQQPLLGSWVWLVGLASTATELYCLHTAYYSPMILTEKIGSLICSQFILPFFNIFLSTCYVGSPPPPSSLLLLLLLVRSIDDYVCQHLPQHTLSMFSSSSSSSSATD